VQRGILLVIAALCGCKSRGTITLDFDLAGSNCAPFGSAYWADAGVTCAGADGGATAIQIDHYVLYAVQDASCIDCACGGGLTQSSHVVRVCPAGDSATPCMDVQGLAVDLSPGRWAVVLEAYAPAPEGSRPCLVASQCIEADVDADGVSSKDAGFNDMTGCSACAM
jgi:hypothetical protein